MHWMEQENVDACHISQKSSKNFDNKEFFLTILSSAKCSTQGQQSIELSQEGILLRSGKIFLDTKGFPQFRPATLALEIGNFYNTESVILFSLCCQILFTDSPLFKG